MTGDNRVEKLPEPIRLCSHHIFDDREDITIEEIQFGCTCGHTEDTCVVAGKQCPDYDPVGGDLSGVVSVLSEYLNRNDN